jgi:radical SAM protein with 4Fe4S-binding SPASM domain
MNLKRNISIFLQKKLSVRIAVALGLTDAVLDLYWKKIDSDFRDEVAETGIMPLPTTVYLELTMKCNLHCKICHQKGRRGERCDMTTEQVFAVIDKIKNAGIPVLSMTGGEMFLRKDIIDIFKYIDMKEIPLKINTNSTLITKEQIDEIKKLKYFECYGTSIDGNRAKHDVARGAYGAFDKTVAALKAFGETRFQKMICCTMTNENKDCIENIIGLVDDLCIDRVLFLSEMYASDEEIKQSREILSLGENDSIFIQGKEMSNEYSEMMLDMHKKIKSFRKKYSVLAPIYPHIANNRPDEFYNRKPTCSLFCKAFETLIIANNGDIRICQFIGKSFGNLLEGSFDEIWNCKEMKKTRITILKNKHLLPICSSCDCLEEVSGNC